MERKIGEIFEYNGAWLQCVEQPKIYDKTVCAICAFQGNGNCELDRCSGTYRSDKKSVIFKKLEKVGNPFSCNYYGDARLVMMQEYQLFDENVTYCYSMPPMYITDYKHKRIAIEIKQNKEDMEEKKQCGDTRFRIIARAKEHLFQATNIAEDKKELEVLDSFLLRCWQMGWLKQYEDAEEKKLKPFDLEAAKAGKPVCTRGGRNARIICFDVKWATHPIIALIEEGEGERICSYMPNGRRYEGEEEWIYDLMMLPEKKEGWMNVYKKDSSPHGASHACWR